MSAKKYSFHLKEYFCLNFTMLLYKSITLFAIYLSYKIQLITKFNPINTKQFYLRGAIRSHYHPGKSKIFFIGFLDSVVLQSSNNS